VVVVVVLAVTATAATVHNTHEGELPLILLQFSPLSVSAFKSALNIVNLLLF
jgi:hypothetical protein